MTGDVVAPLEVGSSQCRVCIDSTRVSEAPWLPWAKGRPGGRRGMDS